MKIRNLLIVGLVVTMFYSTNVMAKTNSDTRVQSGSIDRDGAVQVGKQPRDGGGNTIWATVHINAAPDVVWRAIHEERAHDPDLAYSKVLSENGSERTVEQKFAFLPLIGTSVCVMRNKEIANRKIEFNLIKSDHFKALEGTWEISPSDGDRGTKLTLTSYVDFGLNVPRMWMDEVTSRKMQRRLDNVKRAAEKAQGELVSHSAT